MKTYPIDFAFCFVDNNNEMFLRQCYRTKNGKRHAYWALVESYRTARGPRQRVVAYLGEMDTSGRLGVKEAAEGKSTRQEKLFEKEKPRWVEVDVNKVRVEKPRGFGGVWLGLELARMLGLDRFFAEMIPYGREEIPWYVMALALVLMRLSEPSSELRIAEHLFEKSALADLLGIPADKINDDRLYRALDKLLPHKAALEVHLKERLGELFDLEYDLLLYDITSTYFEGEAKGNAKAVRGYSRDRRGDCKQVLIALVVDKNGIPLAYEVFAGNRHDSTTVEEIVELVESRYGKAGRIWAMDRGMASEDNMEFLRKENRRYILGTPKSMLKKFEIELLTGDWSEVHDGLEVKLCAAPGGGDETFILCRSRDRREKERAMHEHFEQRIEAGLEKMAAGCRKRRYKTSVIERRVGRLLERNSRAAGLFDVRVRKSADGRAEVVWKKRDAWFDWAMLSEGCYMLRTNITDWSAEDLWKAYIQLTEAEAAFRIHKSDLSIRPIWHQREDRVEAHIFVCFLAYVLWKTLAQLCRGAGLGDEPRRVFDEIGRVQLVDVVLPTRSGVDIRKRCISRPNEHQSILLDRLGLVLPKTIKKYAM